MTQIEGAFTWRKAGEVLAQHRLLCVEGRYAYREHLHGNLHGFGSLVLEEARQACWTGLMFSRKHNSWLGQQSKMGFWTFPESLEPGRQSWACPLLQPSLTFELLGQLHHCTQGGAPQVSLHT